MKKLVLVVIVLSMFVSMAMADTTRQKFNIFVPGKTPAEQMGYLEQVKVQKQASIDAIKQDKTAFADERIASIEKQIELLKAQVQQLTTQKDEIAKNKTAYADAQIAILEARIQSGSAQIEEIKKQPSTIADLPK